MEMLEVQNFFTRIVITKHSDYNMLSSTKITQHGDRSHSLLLFKVDIPGQNFLSMSHIDTKSMVDQLKNGNQS